MTEDYTDRLCRMHGYNESCMQKYSRKIQKEKAIL
jgi:hypothetical protein